MRLRFNSRCVAQFYFSVLCYAITKLLSLLPPARREQDIQYEIYTYKNKQMSFSFLCFPSFPSTHSKLSFSTRTFTKQTLGDASAMHMLPPYTCRAEPSQRMLLAWLPEQTLSVRCQALQYFLTEPRSEAASCTQHNR